jgi:phosphotransferase system HPr (HPr) family protein
MTKRTIIVRLDNGLHARPASDLVTLASSFQCEITLTKGDEIADAKSILSVLSLAVGDGEEVLLTADGLDEATVMAALEELLTADHK